MGDERLQTIYYLELLYIEEHFFICVHWQNPGYSRLQGTSYIIVLSHWPPLTDILEIMSNKGSFCHLVHTAYISMWCNWSLGMQADQPRWQAEVKRDCHWRSNATLQNGRDDHYKFHTFQIILVSNLLICGTSVLLISLQILWRVLEYLLH